MTETLPIFIDARTLHGVVDKPSVQIVAVDTPDEYARAHIPGALQIAMGEFTASQPPVAGLLPAESALEEAFSRAGLRNDAHIVAYDRAGDGQAARLLYTLDAMGHSSFSLLDGGLAAWRAAGFDLQQGAPQAGRSDFKVARQPQRIADRDWIETHLAEPDTRFLDARSAPEYAGTDVRSVRGGHIPGAVNLDWTLLKDERDRLRPRSELLDLLSRHGIDRNREVVNYCQSHVRSSYTYLVLKHLGYERIRGYPGAWSDWGNRDDTPVHASDDPSVG